VLRDIIEISENQDIEVKFDTSKPTMIPIRMIDISKIKTEIGWQPKISIYDGLKKTYEWYSDTYIDLNPEGQKI
jgi:nucleoside-diphosphate-sugar epimerase